MVSSNGYPDWFCPGDGFAPDISFGLMRGKTEIQELLVNRWCSTKLPPGEYTLHAEVTDVQLLFFGDNYVRSYPVAPPKRWVFPITILDENPEAVRVKYLELMRLAAPRSKGAAHRTSYPIERQSALERVAYSREPLALDAQVQMFLNQGLDEFTGWSSCLVNVELAMYFIGEPRIEFAQALAGWLVAHPKTDWYGDIIVWTAFELRKAGGPEFAEVLDGALKGREQPRDPRPIPGMD